MDTVLKKTTPQVNGAPDLTIPATGAQAPVQNGVEVLPMDTHNRRLVANVHPPTWENPTPTGVYNLVVIGGGSAGLVAAAGAAGLGAKVALVEKHLLGGDCLNVGCVPSKSVIRASKALGEIAKAGDFGVHVPDSVEVDFGAVMERMRRVRADISEHDSARRFQELGIDLYLGEGHFTGPDTFAVGGAELRFKKALIATGSRPRRLPLPGFEEVGYLTNETVFSLTELPKRLAVIGAGPIGAELSQSFRRFGSHVTVLDMADRLLPREEEAASAVLGKVFEREGIELALGAQISHAEQTADGKAITFTRGGVARTIVVDEILVAAGRAANIENLGLDAAGIQTHPRGVQVDDQLRTTNPHVYAAGDVALKYQFTHTADATARIVLQNALFPGPNKKVSDLVVPWSTYTDPEVAHVGLYPREAQERGMAIETFTQAIGDVDRGRADGEHDGFVTIHVKKGSDTIVGATVVAKHAGDLVSQLSLAMTAGVGLKQIAATIYPYPTQSEAIKKIGDAYNRTRLTPLVQRLFGWWLAWARR